MEILLLLSLITALIFYLKLRNYKKQGKEKILKEYQKEFAEERGKLERQLSNEALRTADAIQKEIARRKSQLYELEQQTEKTINLEKGRLALELENVRKDIIKEKEKAQLELKSAKDLEIQTIQMGLANMRAQAEENFELLCDELNEQFNIRKNGYELQIKQLQDNLDDFKAKQEAFGQEILRRRAIEEQQDFYKVCLSDSVIKDIAILREVAPRLNYRSHLDKLIYDAYYSKEVQAMVKRVLNGRQPSGIYKITRLKTGEIYIGKSTNIRDRWIQHCKTANNCGTIAHSVLHTTMEKDGVSNFTFELLEEVPKEKLGEREKYWINFYKSKEYGLNEKEG